MYPFLSTGKFVCAYVPVSTVSTSADIPNATNFYLNQQATVKANSDIYHNPSDGSLLSNSGEDKKVRATVTKGENCQILFADGDYYFIKTDSNLTGFIKQANLKTKSNIIESGSSNICGDVDNNGKVGLSDAIALSRYLLGRMTSSQIQLSAADTNKDGNVDIKDVVIIQRYLLGYIERLPNVPTVEVEEIWLPSSMELKVNETRSVAYSVIPDNATDKTLSWTSKNTSIATVSNTGAITGKGVGTTQIIATANNGVQKGITVNVVRNYVDVTSISINNANPAPVYSGTSIQLSATVSPSDATDKSVTWTSSNPDVASVDSNGNVTTKSAGTVVITATSSNPSIKATSTVKVNQLVSYIGNGNYTLKLKGTNMYLDHQGGTANGTNVHLWEGDGQSNNNQKIKLERIDDYRYKLWSVTSSNLMIDVNRGSSYSDPLKIGLNVDLWENNDWQAQEWLFTRTYDGYYILRLNMLQEGAIEVSGKSNGANIFYGTYNCDNDMQKWELIESNPIPLPEQDGQIYNTGDIGNVHVRSGPDSSYPSIGGFDEGQIITVIGDTNATWLRVRGANRHNNAEIIEGYTHRDYIRIPPYIPPIPTPTEPNLYSNSYNKTLNPFAQANLYGQCTWYAWGRANEVTGKNIPCRNNAKTWYDVARNNGYSVGSVPKANSIAVWSKGEYGHVAYVEAVSGNNVTITESNWDRVTYGYQYTIEDGIYYYSGYKTLTISQMNSRYGTLLGYIYL
jgi:surface antigen